MTHVTRPGAASRTITTALPSRAINPVTLTFRIHNETLKQDPSDKTLATEASLTVFYCTANGHVHWAGYCNLRRKHQRCKLDLWFHEKKLNSRCHWRQKVDHATYRTLNKCVNKHNPRAWKKIKIPRWREGSHVSLSEFHVIPLFWTEKKKDFWTKKLPSIIPSYIYIFPFRRIYCVITAVFVLCFRGKLTCIFCVQ